MSARNAALLLETLRLRDTGDREQLAGGWRTADPTGLADLLDYEGAALWLYRRLADLRMLNVPDRPFATDLTKRARRITANNLLVDAQRDAVVRTLGTAGIPHLLLKGCALRLMTPRLAYADARLTADVDVLVEPDSVEHAWERLQDAGFAIATDDEDRFEKHHHLPPLTDRRSVIVELHRSTSPRTQPTDAWTRMSAGATQVAHAGTTTLLPAPTELLWHAVTHAANHGPHGFLLRHFLDGAVVIGSGQNLDWDAIRERLSTDELEDPAAAIAWLAAARCLSGDGNVPYWLASGPEFDLSRALSWRATVSALLARQRERCSRSGKISHASARLSRLLLEEGIRAELKMGTTPPKFGRTALARAGRTIAALCARVMYLTWRRFHAVPARPKSTVDDASTRQPD